mgnify:CR=1 FL=1
MLCAARCRASVEGFEKVVLDTVDWDQVSIHLIGVEQTTNTLQGKQRCRAVRDTLEAHGFVHIDSHTVMREINQGDDIYMNRTYLTQHLAHVATALGMNVSQMADFPEEAKMKKIRHRAQTKSLHNRVRCPPPAADAAGS